MTTGDIIDAVGITAAIGVMLLEGLRIAANIAFKGAGLPDDEGSDR